MNYRNAMNYPVPPTDVTREMHFFKLHNIKCEKRTENFATHIYFIHSKYLMTA